MVAIRAPLNLLTYAACVLGVTPLYAYLDRPVQLVAPLALVLGVFGERRGRHLLGRLPATLLSFALFGLYALRISRDVLVEPVVNILVLLLAIRLLTAKSGRDYLQIFVLTIFALAGSSLLSLNLLFFPALVLLVLCVTVGLVLLTFYSTDPEMTLPRRRLRSLFGVALVLPVGSLLLMLVFFVILPRTQHPMWNFLNPGAAASSG
ncbi:MAG TPA: transglutaminaseTgpA domain-containing protein, partial [Gammaproteobacteria bacterium]|nr:transglutaminaseTgpA domain-containing protein [Gammaproteobacteria bacterium]